MRELSADEIFHETVVVPRRAFPPYPDLQLIEAGGVMQIVTPSSTGGPLNEVIHAELGHLSDPEIEATIDRTIAEYRSRGLKFRWTVGPLATPEDLGERLLRRGLEPTRSFGMSRSTSGVSPVPAGVVVEVDATNVDAYTEAMCEGWAVDPGPFHAMHRALFEPSPHRQHLFMACTPEGKVVATASYIAFERSAYLIGAVVLPAYRGRGAYRMLVDARLAHAHAAGLPLATTRAMEATSAPILANLGFDSVCRFTVYRG